MGLVAIFVGAFLFLSVLADMVNTLVTTRTSQHRWWLTQVWYRRTWKATAGLAQAVRWPSVREALLATYAPLSVLLLLVLWVAQQILGLALIWWGIGGVEGAESFADSIYFSGVVYFTVGFGELVPSDTTARAVALVEAFAGVLTTALVIGYLPALYAAYNERERKLMTLDDGSEDRITPTNLVCAWAPTADPEELMAQFQGWEDWIAGVLETHTTFPMLKYFRSKDDRQSWITALGLVADAALHCELIVGASGRAPYWTLRRAVKALDALTLGADLDAYVAEQELQGADDTLFRELCDQLEAHGFELYPYEDAVERGRILRIAYGPKMEFLIDELVAPRGFWGHDIGIPLAMTSLDGRVRRRSLGE